MSAILLQGRQVFDIEGGETGSQQLGRAIRVDDGQNQCEAQGNRFMLQSAMDTEIVSFHDMHTYVHIYVQSVFRLVYTGV